MYWLLSFVLVVAVVFVSVWAIVHDTKAKADENEYKQYKELWGEAVELLAFNGQITDEQLEKIKPRVNNEAPATKLPTGEGFSEDRRDVEIARARQGLPPADNLCGMFSEDIRDVRLARAEYAKSTTN